MTTIATSDHATSEAQSHLGRYALCGLLALAAALPFVGGKTGLISNFTFLQLSLMIVYAIAVLGLNQ
ncbi:hypothetical protein, partial [Klebsiella pneumoniae]|uniref:hypothetical protein n=1 Tax=Klebsiella pneumoniae TaxID=573 RepID=UPI0013D079AA